MTPTTKAAADSPDPQPRSVEFRVRYAETDQMGVVYHANYLVWCEIGRTDYIRALGMSYADIEKAGVSLAVSEASLRFHASALYDDLVRVTTTLASVRSRAVAFDYVIHRVADGAKLVTAHTALIAIDDVGRPISFPPAIRAIFEQGT